MQTFVVDPASTSLDYRFALIYTKRKKRKRFPQGCVQLMASQAQAIARADAQKHLYAACVYGPSISSEGTRMYYLVQWLT